MVKNIVTLEGHRDWVWSVVFSPDGTKLASGSDNTVELWEVETGKHIHTFQGDGRALMSVAFSPNGTRLVSGVNDWNDSGVGYIRFHRLMNWRYSHLIH